MTKQGSVFGGCPYEGRTLGLGRKESKVVEKKSERRQEAPSVEDTDLAGPEKSTLPARYRPFLDRGPFEPRHHVRMARIKRAGQFAPFAALRGLSGAIAQKGRAVEEQAQDLDLDPDQDLDQE